MVSDDAAAREVYAGEQGLLSHSPSGKIFVDMSVNEGAFANGITKGKSPSILNSEFKAAFALLKHLAKDLRLAGEQGLQTPLFQPLLHSFQQAMDNGLVKKM